MATAVERAQEVATNARDHKVQQAASEVQDEMRRMSPNDRRDFFNELARQKGQPGGLPGFEITGDERGHNRSVALEGQRPMYRENDGEIRRGQGPADAIHRAHPDWPIDKVMKEAGRVNQETGRKAYNEGEKLTLNPDGSVTIRRDDPSKPGSYSETRYKDKQPVSTRKGDGNNWTETQYGYDGKPSTTTKHEQGEGGNYKETVTGPDGKEVSTKTRTMSPDGTYKERTTQTGSGNFKETNYDVNGNPTGSVERSYPNPQDKNSYSEVRTDGSGNITSKMDRHDSKTFPGYSDEDTTRYTNGQPGTPTSRLYKDDKVYRDPWTFAYGYDVSPEDPNRLKVNA